MVATAKTVYGIVRYFEQTAADAGIKPQQVRVQASRLAYRIDIHRDSVTSALNEDYLGFTKVEGYWMVAKDYNWKEVKECFESTYSDVIKLQVWRAQPDIESAPVGDSELVRTTNKVVNKKCDKFHLPKEFEGIKACFTDKLLDKNSTEFIDSNREGYFKDAVNVAKSIKEENETTWDKNSILPIIQMMLSIYKDSKNTNA